MNWEVEESERAQKTSEPRKRLPAAVVGSQDCRSADLTKMKRQTGKNVVQPHTLDFELGTKGIDHRL